MVKLSQQIAEQQDQGRPTRTQRVLAQQEARKKREEFDRLKKQAQDLQEGEFANLKSLDEYEEKYNLLDPKLKPFFATPQQLRQEKAQRIITNKEKVEERIAWAEQRKQEEYEEYRKDIEWYREARSKAKTSERKDRYKEREDERDDEWDEDEKYWIYYIKGLKEGLGKLNSDQDVSYNDIDNYADDLGDYRKDREEAKNRQRKQNKEAFNKLLEESPFSNVFKEYNEKYKGKIDWTNQKNIDLILEQNFASKNPDAWLKSKTSGLTLGETKTVKNLTSGGYDEVTYWTDASGKKQFQLIRSTGSGVLQYRQLGGKFSGQVTKFQGLSDSQIQLQQKTQLDKAYKEVTKPDKLYLDLQKVDASKFGYVQRGTISDQPRVDFIPITADTPKNESKFISNVKKYWDKIPSGDLYLNVPDKMFGVGGIIGIGSFGLGGISPIKTSSKSINLREKKEEFLDYLDEKQQAQFEKEITRTGIKEKADTKFQEEYETRFYRSDVGRQAFYGETDFEEATRKFAESDEAKIIGKKYQMDIQQARAGKFTREGFAIAGLGLAETGVKLIPSTVKGAVVEGVLIYTGAKVLKAIPPVVTNIGTGAIGTVGLATALSPTASPEAKAGGVITAGISFGILGLQGVQYLRRPTIKTERIVVKSSIDPKLQRGFVTKQKVTSVKDLAGKTTVTEYYKANKLTEQIVYGRRTVVSTKFRDLLGLKPIYQGIPYQQRGTTYVLEGLRGTTTFTTPSGYQKAFELLTKRGGLTQAQAKATLRYYQPKQIFSTYQADIVVRYGDLYKTPKIAIEGTRDIYQPSNIIDDALGIKTRGATTIREYIRGRGTIVGDVKGRTLYSTTFDIEKAYLTESGAVYQKLTQAGKTTKQFQQLTSVADKGDEILRVQVDKGVYSVSKDFPYTVFDEKSLAKQVIPRGRLSFGESESALFKRNVPRVDVDLREVYGISLKEEIIKKAKPVSDVSKLQDPKYLKDLIKTLKNVYGDKAVKSAGITPPSTSLPSGSSASAVQEIKQTTRLKSTLSPVQSVKQQLKAILKIEQRSSSIAGLGLVSATASASASKQRSALVPKTDVTNVLKNLIKEDYALRSAQSPLTAQAQALSQAQVPVLDQGLFNLPVITPPTPSISRFDINPPTIPTLPILFPTAERGRGRKRKTQTVQDLAYLPDFTSRALGLEAETVSEKQAKKKLKQLLTGLELRRPVKVKF